MILGVIFTYDMKFCNISFRKNENNEAKYHNLFLHIWHDLGNWVCSFLICFVIEIFVIYEGTFSDDEDQTNLFYPHLAVSKFLWQRRKSTPSMIVKNTNQYTVCMNSSFIYQRINFKFKYIVVSPVSCKAPWKFFLNPLQYSTVDNNRNVYKHIKNFVYHDKSSSLLMQKY